MNSTNPKFDYQNEVNPNFINSKNKLYNWGTPAPVKEGAILPVQGGNQTPPFLFNDHWVVDCKLNGTNYYFDPSYGKFYQATDNLTAYQNLILSSIQFVGAGFAYTTTDPNGKPVRHEAFGFKAITQANIGTYIVPVTSALRKE